MIKKMVILVLLYALLAGCGDIDVDIKKCDEASCQSDDLECDEHEGSFSLEDEQVVFGTFIEDQDEDQHLDINVEYQYRKPNCQGYGCYKKVATEYEQIYLDNGSCMLTSRNINDGPRSLKALSSEYGGPVGEWRLVVDYEKDDKTINFEVTDDSEEESDEHSQENQEESGEQEEEQQQASGCQDGETEFKECTPSQSDCPGFKKRECVNGHWNGWGQIECQVNESAKDPYNRDADEDGYGNASNIEKACSRPDGYVENAKDCNDYNEHVHPYADEVCDGLDNDCDGEIDEGVKNTYYRDYDGDGYGNKSNTEKACSEPTGYVKNAQDCNDHNASINPDIKEICGNSVDDDCNGLTDCEDDCFCGIYYLDGDGDGYGNQSNNFSVVQDPDNYVNKTGDCNDDNASIQPEADEVCDNSVDDDCDGDFDCNDTECDCRTYYLDADGDGFGNQSANVSAVKAPDGYVKNSVDCNDNNTSIHPNADEVCGNSIDDNCNGLMDCNDSECECATYFTDEDEDGYGVESQSVAVKALNNYVNKTGDCNDNNASIHPGADEVCNDVDMNCNGDIYEDACGECIPGKTQNETCEGKSKGPCEPGWKNRTCQKNASGKGEWSEWSDCKDVINPQTEWCDGIDNDCDGKTDEDCKTNELQKCINKKDKCSFSVNRTTICLKGENQCKELEVGGNVTIDGKKVEHTDYAKINNTVLLNATNIKVVNDEFDYTAEKTNELGENNETSPINDKPLKTNTSFSNTTNSTVYSGGEIQQINGTSEIDNNTIEFEGVRIHLDENENFSIKRTSYDKLNLTADKETKIEDGHLSTAYVKIAPGSRYSYVGDDKFSLFVPAEASAYELYVRTPPSPSFSIENCNQCGLIDFVNNNATLKGNYEFEKPHPSLPMFTNVIESDGKFRFSLDAENITNLYPSNFDVYSGDFMISYGLTTGYRFVDSEKPYAVENINPDVNITNKTLLQKRLRMYSESSKGFYGEWGSVLLK